MRRPSPALFSTLILVQKGADASPTDAAARQQLGIGGHHTTAVVVKWK